jgi:hypothetical protein
MTFGKLQVDQIESSTRILNVDDLLSGVEDVVTSVGLSAPTGFTVSGSPVTGSGVISLTYSQGYSLPSNTSQSNWDTAYLERRYWDGGSSGLNASTARTSLGLGNSSTLNIGTIAGTVAAGDDARFTTNLSYTPSTRLLSSSTGSDVTIPEATTTVPGFQSAADKVKLDSIATGAQVNVPTNLTYTQSTRLLGSSTGDDVTLPDATTSFSGLMSATDKGKLDGIASGAEVNVNADWDSVSGDSLILNKPSIPPGADSLPQPLGVAAVGNSLKYSRENHVHGMPSAADVGADPSGTAASAVSAHVGTADPHPNKYASAAQGALAATAIQPGNAALSDAREWSAATVSQAEAEAGSLTSRRAFTPQRVFQAVAAWWAASAFATKLSGIASGATANSTDAELRDRTTHTGTQAVGTITGLGTAATLNHGTAAGDLVRLDPTTGRLPAVDGSQLTNLPGGSGTSFAGYAVGNYVIPTTGGLAVGTAISANQVALMPFMVQRAITISELAVRVTTAGAGVDFQLAIYGSDSGLPSGTPVISTTNLSGGTAGLVQDTVTATTLQPGLLYWQAVSASGALTFLSVAANNSYHSSIIGSTALSEMLAATGTNFHCRLITGQTVGTWPDLTGVSFVAPSSSQRRVPVFAFLISALP